MLLFFFYLSSLSVGNLALLISQPPKNKTPSLLRELGVLRCKSLTMTYFHTGTRTIIGANSFHCPARDGKEWYQIAMVIRHNL